MIVQSQYCLPYQGRIFRFLKRGLPRKWPLHRRIGIHTCWGLFTSQKPEKTLSLRYLKLFLDKKVDSFNNTKMFKVWSCPITFWCSWNRGLLSPGSIAKSAYAYYRPSHVWWWLVAAEIFPDNRKRNQFAHAQWVLLSVS